MKIQALFWLAAALACFAPPCLAAPPPTFSSAKALYEAKKYDEARHAFGSVSKRFPDDMQSVFYAAMCYKELGDAHHFTQKLEQLRKFPGNLTLEQRVVVDREYLPGVKIEAEAARAAYAAGKHKEALKAFGSILKRFPNNSESVYYSALCYKGLEDNHHFAEKLELLRKQPGSLTPAQRESVDAEYVEMLFRLRLFAKAAANADDFPTSHSQSIIAPKIQAMGLLATYERGYKKAWDAVNHTETFERDDIATKQKNWIAGTEDLRAFLSKADNLTPGNLDPSLVTEDHVKDCIWTACIVVGDDARFQRLLDTETPEARQRAAWIRDVTNLEIHPDRIDENFDAIQEFMRKYPQSERVITLPGQAARIYYMSGMRWFFRSAHLAGEINEEPGGAKSKEKEKALKAADAKAQEYYGLLTTLCEGGLLEINPRTDSEDHNALVSMYLDGLALQMSSGSVKPQQLLDKAMELEAKEPLESFARAQCRMHQARALDRISRRRNRQAVLDLYESAIRDFKGSDLDRQMVESDALVSKALLYAASNDGKAGLQDCEDRLKRLPASEHRKSALTAVEDARGRFDKKTKNK